MYSIATCAHMYRGSMFVCMYVCRHLETVCGHRRKGSGWVYIETHTHTRTHAHTHACVHTHTHTTHATHTHSQCKHAHMHTHTYTPTHTYIYTIYSVIPTTCVQTCRRTDVLTSYQIRKSTAYVSRLS